MIFLKTEDEIELMRAANLLVADTLTEIAKNIRPGVTTKQLDALAEEFIRDHGAMPTFKGFPNPYGGPFPASICTSVNDEVVHGVPNDRPLEEETLSLSIVVLCWTDIMVILVIPFVWGKFPKKSRDF